jgi:hypothetical protein
MMQRYTLDIARFLFLCLSYPLRKQVNTASAPVRHP